MPKFDVIIIGAGISGLSTGALLTHDGWKVLLLEKRQYLGGRAASIQHKGHILDDGPHMPDEAGHLEKVFDILGLEYPRLLRYQKGEGYWNGAWRPMKEIFPLREAKEIFQEFLEMSFEELEAYSDVSIRDWCIARSDVEGWEALFNYFGQLLLVGNKFEDLSMGELIYILKEHFQRGKRLGEIGGTISGGLSSLTEPLRNYIETHGGEICLNTPVNDIVIEKGRVRGVEVEIGERLFPSQILDIDFIEVPRVICTLPIWDLFTVISENEFPVWYRDWIHHLREKVCHVWNVVCAVEKPLWDIKMFKWVPKLPRTDVFGIFFQHQSYGDKANDTQVNLVLQGNYNDLPDLSEWRWAKTRRAVRRCLDLLEEDARELIPGLAEATKWRVRQASVFGLAEAPGMTGNYKPSMVPPGVENLYIVSDTVREGRGLGMQSVAKSSLFLFERFFSKG